MKYMSFNEDSVYLFAFRYALGRMTTAPTTVSEEITRRAKEIRPETKLQMQHEISLAIQWGRAGDPCDVATWRALEVALR